MATVQVIRKMDRALAHRCRELVYRIAKEYDIPPVTITAHYRCTAADAARFKVWRIMLGWGMTRQLIADIFGRDRRRLRASVFRRRKRKIRIISKKQSKPTLQRSVSFQPVGNQFVWSFAVPLKFDQPIMQQIERQPVTRSIMPYVKPLPEKLQSQLLHDERLALARFYERQARIMRYSEAGG